MGYIGCDIDGKQLEAAAKNLASALVNTDVQLMQADAEGVLKFISLVLKVESSPFWFWCLYDR